MDLRTVVGIVLRFILIFGTFGTIATIFLLFPHQVVRIQGKIYQKWYKGLLNWTDDEINSWPMLPTDRFFMEKRSDFIREAPENPEKFTRLITLYRFFGLVLTVSLALAFVLAIIGVIALQGDFFVM